MKRNIAVETTVNTVVLLGFFYCILTIWEGIIMHMADALMSPAVGTALWGSSAVVMAYSAKKVQKGLDDKKIPLMGVMGAFVFAAQMINFSIPMTGSSGHIGGGLLLSIILGPYAGFITMASILAIQALFFADGGLLALGANIINLGFFTCFISYPFIFKPMMKNKFDEKSLFKASLVSSIIGLQLGAFAVVIETLISGKTELPFWNFLMLMQPIHLAIGLVEGLVTASVVAFVWKNRPEVISSSFEGNEISNISIKKVASTLLISAIIVGGFVSWFASSNPDGLEWSMFKTSGQEELVSEGSIYDNSAELQEKIAILPDYGFKNTQGSNIGTSTSGIIGGGITFLAASSIGFGINAYKKNKKKSTNKAA